MRFNDGQTEEAIEILTMVQSVVTEKEPLPKPSAVAAWESRAAEGDREAYKRVMSAKLRLVYPVIPEPPYISPRHKLWQSIIEGRYEGILVVNSLDYGQAYDDVSFPLRLGSYLERWLSYAVQNELARAFTDGWKGTADD